MRANHFQRFYHSELKAFYRNYLKNIKGRKIRISPGKFNLKGKYDSIIADNLIGEASDIYGLFEKIKRYLKYDSTVLISYYNPLWEPILILATHLGLRKNIPNQNWIDEEDLKNFLNLTGFELISTQKRILLPANVPVVSPILNHILSFLPVIRNLCLMNYTVARPINKLDKDLSISIIIPARNEEGNISKIIPSIPRFGKSQEYIFVEGNSKDKTWEKILQEGAKRKSVVCLKQDGKGKADAVWKGFNHSTGEVLMIYDADMTVDPKDLEKFYKAIKNNPNSFVNGSRMVYPMEHLAMQTLNKIGNKVFGTIFTLTLGQNFKDTLCGTKVINKRDFNYIKKNFKYLFKTDPFGDFVLIFGAIKRNLKVIEIPVRYKERQYGSTNISRFKHGLLLLKMTLAAFKEFRFF